MFNFVMIMMNNLGKIPWSQGIIMLGENPWQLGTSYDQLGEIPQLPGGRIVSHHVP